MSSDREDEDASDSIEATRSGRHIRRRRFDDEIVESSLGAAIGGTAQRGGLQGTPAPLQSPAPTIAPVAAIVKEDPPMINSAASAPLSPPGGNFLNSGSLLPVVSGEVSMDYSDEEPDEWRASDDLLLINAVVQLRDLELVLKGTKFSYPFSPEQVTNRWRQLLYSEPMSPSSESAFEAINELHPSTVEYLERKMPFSAAEEAILASVGPHQAPTQQKLQSILDANRKIFQPCRTAKHLLKHWQLLRQYFLLADQHVPVAASEKGIPLNFSDVEDEFNDPQNDTQLRRRRDLDVDYEQRQLQRSARREMKRLEAELPLWQALTDSITGAHAQDFDNQTLAVLRGRLVRYLMRSKEISLGRSSRDVTVDIDFSLEGPAYKRLRKISFELCRCVLIPSQVSRRQAIIKLRTNGEFVFANEGKRPVYVDGNPVLTGNKCRLNHNSVVELAGLRFVFLVNMKLINSGQADLIQ
ncbi:microspherule protein 1-like [Tropilaelaps mercedesae]|uniref:Microspherule protein 1-like n=1 Tax=Tropilaelaps mercedesae TaxID=418985 RepID=A0A1V9XDB6_9ACAR|nr:microspherule protein 1-like [Tropilaelaps mercedesae]